MTPRPSLLMVAHAAELYGSDRCLHIVIEELVSSFDVTVAVPADGPGIAVMEALGARVVRLGDYAVRRRNFTARGILPWLAHLAPAMRALRRLHASEHFALVYSNTLAAAAGGVLAHRLRVPAVLHVHECPPAAPWLQRALLWPADRYGAAVICNSQFTADWVVRQRPSLAQRTEVVYNGLDLPPEPAMPAPNPAALRITLVARVAPKKGHGPMFEALALAAAAGRRWEIHCYGDTLPEHRPLEQELRDYLDAHGLSNQVHWHGFEPNLQTRYGNADIAVVPSVVPEEFSLVCLEAQSLLLPVVATGPGGASEVVADGVSGLIVAPRDPDALYRAIAALDDDPDRRREMGSAGRRRAEQLFSKTAFATGVRSVVMRCVNGSPERVA